MVLEPRKLVSNVDKMAYEHLKSIGAIIPKGAGRPKSTSPRKIPKSRVGWKKLDPFKGSAICEQCGGHRGNFRAQGSWPYSMTLCDYCSKVHLDSVAKGLKPSDEINF